MLRMALERHTLQWMISFMVVVNTMVTMNLNIAIVSMVNFHDDMGDLEESNEIVCPNSTFFMSGFLESDDNEEILPSYQNENYNWSAKECDMALGGHYRINYIFVLPAGILCHKYGSKIVSGYGQLISSCMSSLIPLLAGYGPVVVTWIRAVQGALSFMAVPAGMYVIIANWSPPQERGMFAASALVGSGAGQVLGNIFFGYVAQYLGWHYVFHLTSLFGIIWTILWYMLVYEFPSDHPTITIEEKTYIETSIERNDTPPEHGIPWKSILTSVPFITSVLASSASIWVFVVIITYKPIFLKSMYGLNVNEVGIIAGVCLFLTTVLALVVGYVIDLLMKRKIVSLNLIRKSCSFTGCVVSCIPLALIVLVKCNIDMVVICLSLMSFLKGFSMHGAPMGVVDMSPKFCAILEGISASVTSFLTFVFSTILTYYSGILSVEDLWKYAFLLTASYSMLVHSIYIIFGSSDVQSWNFEKSSKTESGEVDGLSLRSKL